MKLLYGLGNPDDENSQSRHNAGWMVLDKLYENTAEKSLWQINSDDEVNTADVIIKGSPVVLCKPTRYMNDQGVCLENAIKRRGLSVSSQVMVIHDDLDLKLGTLRLKQKGSPPGHNGLKSIMERLRSDIFWRLRIGIDSRVRRDEKGGADFVLSDFTEEEKNVIDPTLTKASEIVRLWVLGQCDKALQLANKR